MNPSSLTRREFIKTSAAVTAIAAGTRPSLFAAEDYGGKKIPFGVQLYSVRKECAKDLPGTLAALGKMGYKGAEFADYFGNDAKTLRRMLDDCGLQCCGTHIYLDTMLGDKLAGTVEFNQTLGNRFLIVRSLPEKYTATRQGYEHAADLCSEVAAKIKPHGMRIGYHNHGAEFQPRDGELPWDTFFNRASRDVAIQLDTANAASVGADPLVFLKKFPGRVPSVHAKGYSKSKPGAIIGDDDLPWKEIFRVCESTAGTEWYIVEYESELFPPLVAVQKTIEVMRRWGKC